MIVRGFDQAVARQHGYHIVMINGVAASVKDGSVKPVNRLTGDCGASWIYLDAAGHLEYYYATGFDSLPLPAVFFGWSVNVYGPGGYNRAWTFGGGIFSTAWSSGNIYARVNLTGLYTAIVDSSSSWVILIDGTICGSLGPVSQVEVP
ncbi:hypothetical protein [Thermogemmatispora sp.]|uniref:hypothetical protein n=1 Tax=Thermogemmatispora sp. TaxID=1968838 RepID=UPI002ACC00B0|nr:hypothetical protein [Thermogemmatispora sp.]